ncbi:hypothetical protein ULMS_18120 [Patiriisocius marinistellae]|uniref:Universal stress protein n=1 Tax=Patiriisocius marinistellae TaxID=2494560 RepID=A0A5J4FYT1_9FLAO|nr:hypothetical protein [Patiriisocius marinistellae]GEQ86304.1 hypothetical protein ULMS_18120 [Patiriisocius marinistellae]
MKKILIPLDFKVNCYEAIDYAINFFKHEKCHFYFINCFKLDIDGLNAIHLLQADDDWFEKPKHQSEKNLGSIIKKFTINNRGKDHRFSAISKCNNLIEGVKSVIEEIDIDIVILAGKANNISTEKYSRNTKRIIENIRECPIMIIPSSAKIHENPEFVLVSNFEEELPKTELENWYELVKTARGLIRIVTLASRDKMTSLQKLHQNRVRFQIEMFSNTPIVVEYIETANELKDFANCHSDYVICLIDKKPDFWRICGITHSKITNLGPLQSTPLIALHR